MTIDHSFQVDQHQTQTHPHPLNGRNLRHFLANQVNEPVRQVPSSTSVYSQPLDQYVQITKILSAGNSHSKNMVDGMQMLESRFSTEDGRLGWRGGRRPEQIDWIRICDPLGGEREWFPSREKKEMLLVSCMQVAEVTKNKEIIQQTQLEHNPERSSKVINATS